MLVTIPDLLMLSCWEPFCSLALHWQARLINRSHGEPVNVMAPHPLASMCQWQLSVTVGPHPPPPRPLQYLSQFQISLNTIKQRHPQARASVTLNSMTNFTYNTLWNPPKRSTNQPNSEPQQIWKWLRNAPDMLLVIDQPTLYIWEKEVTSMGRAL